MPIEHPFLCILYLMILWIPTMVVFFLLGLALQGLYKVIDFIARRI